jgi:hypothetical protein
VFTLSLACRKLRMCRAAKKVMKAWPVMSPPLSTYSQVFKPFFLFFATESETK